jgi:hypothetical protein
MPQSARINPAARLCGWKTQMYLQMPRAITLRNWARAKTMVCRLIGSVPMSRAGLGLKSGDERSRRASCRSLPYALKAADAETLKGLRSSCSRTRREKQFLVCNCDVAQLSSALDLSVANYSTHAAIGVWYMPRQCFCHR